MIVWGVFMWHGLGPLLHLNTSFTGDRNVTLIRDNLHSSSETLFSQQRWFIPSEFVQCSSAQIDHNWFEEYSDVQRIVSLPCPLNMNPIELVERSIRMQDRAPTDIRGSIKLSKRHG